MTASEDAPATPGAGSETPRDQPPLPPEEVEEARRYYRRLVEKEGMAEDYAAALAVIRADGRRRGPYRDGGSRRIVRITYSTSARRVETCAACGSWDSESSKYGRTAHMRAHYREHDRPEHVREVLPDIWAQLWGSGDRDSPGPA